MNAATLSTVRPIQGVPDGKGNPDPAVRQAWLDQRRGGITATEIRDWGDAKKRRAIVQGKVTGIDDDLWDVPVPGREYTLGDFAQHGNERETVIADWVKAKYGIEPCAYVYSHGENLRHLASPDGISLDPFTGELLVGVPEARLAEIKTSVKNLIEGMVIVDGIMERYDPASPFGRKGYYVQMQWQMYVMNATATLFVAEQHDGKRDPETGKFTPLGPPEAVWVLRDQALIDVLVNEVAAKALAEIDAARIAFAADGLPPASDLPAEHAALVADLLRARDREAIAKAAREKAWAALQEFYMGEGRPDVSIDAGFARLTVSTSSRPVSKFDEEAARKKAPAHWAKHDEMVKKYTRLEVVTKQTLTITAKKGKK